MSPETIVINAEATLAGCVDQILPQDWSSLEIRTPRTEDMSGIVRVARSCEPFLTAHMSYIYWMNIRNHGETCAVAELNGELVGWCSIFPIPSGNYFLHQLGIVPSARRRGVGESLLAFLLNKLKKQTAVFELEFTIDRKNCAAQILFKGFAERAGLQLLKTGAVVELLEENCTEEVYVMTACERNNGHPPVGRPFAGYDDLRAATPAVIKHRARDGEPVPSRSDQPPDGVHH